MDEQLGQAIDNEDVPGVIAALEGGADPNKMLMAGTPLVRIIRANKPQHVLSDTSTTREIMQALLDRGANPSLQDPGGMTPLMHAVGSANDDAVEVLMDIDPPIDINMKDFEGRTALFYSGYPDFTETLIENGATIDIQDNAGKSPYIHAIPRKLYQVCDVLVELGMEKGLTRDQIVNVKNIKGRNVAFYALYPEGVDQMKKDGVDFEAKDITGITPFMFLVSQSFSTEELLLKFLEYGVNPDVESPVSGMTPLLRIAAKDKPRVVAKLIEKGVDLNRQTPKGNTALMLAAKHGKLDVVKMLVEAGADTTLKNLEGATAYDLATSDEIKEALTPSAKWTGMTQADVSLFDTFFEDTINYSCCPVCLAYTQRSSACRYMTHDCKQQMGVIRHKRLYELYQNSEGNITWCTVCGRPCRGHRHYKLAPHETPSLPPLAPVQTGMDVFGGEADCIKDGGGGVPEKVKRLDRMRAWALELQSEVGKITEDNARRQLVEEAWNAPLARAPTGRILEQGRFTVPATDFPAPPAPVADAAPAAPAEDIPKPADEVANVPEVVEAGGFDSFEAEDDVVPVIRFVHKKKDGTVYRHEDNKLIGKTGLTNFLRAMNGRFGTEEFGLCFAHPDCDAKLWPQDVQPYVEDPAVFEDYRTKFNNKFKAVQGGRIPLGGNPVGKPLFVLATGVQCAKPENKAGTYRRRRRQTKKNKTRRTNK